MTLLTADRVSRKFPDQIVLDSVSFTIKQGEHIALIGRNGAGKTTLLEIIVGKQTGDTGTLHRSKNCVIDYVEQEKTDYLNHTLFEFVSEARPDLRELKQEIGELEQHLVHYPGDEARLEELGEKQHQFEQLGGFNFENEISTILQGLGFAKDVFSKRLAGFSGGEKNRAGLARILAGRGNLLLLDEPTNHLDIESTVWLEEYLKSLDKACLIVSHDRSFLASVAGQVWELEDNKLEFYSGGLEYYLKERDERRRLAAHRFRHQREEIKRIEDFIARNMAGQKTKQAQSKLKYLGRIERITAPKSEASNPKLKMHSSGRSFSHVLSIDDMTVGYGGAPVLEKVHLDLYRGQKVGVIGRNGSGKSTLLKALIGEIAPDQGEIKLGNNVNVAYFDQELSDLDEQATVLDNVWQLDLQALPGELRSFLARFGFSGEDVFKQVAALSGGEKTKLCLARLLYHPANLVIMDEPTNHLDIQAREALEKALKEYDGSCLLVSHDRYFLSQVADRILYLSHGRGLLFDGGYQYFVDRMAASKDAAAEKPKETRSDFQEFKEQSKARSRLRKKIEKLKEEIIDNERQLKKIEEQINYEISADDWEALDRATAEKQELEEKIIEQYLELERQEDCQTD